jgi:EpsI family protein
MSRQLVVLLALVVVTLGVVSQGPGEPREIVGQLAERLPEALDGWRALGPQPADTLPADPRALETVRQGYGRNGHTVRLAVARYPSRNHPDHRPLPDLIVGARTPSQATAAALSLDGAEGVTVRLVELQRRDRTVAVAYWYQVDGEPIVGEYRLRFRQFLDTLQGRPQPLLLIRVAADDRARLAEFLQSFYPRLKTILAS